jgi:hypothetical protein
MSIIAVKDDALWICARAGKGFLEDVPSVGFQNKKRMICQMVEILFA